MGSTRQPSCKLSAMQADQIFPAEEQPLPECVLCHLARSDGNKFYCGMVERMKGRYINRPMLTDREVKLHRGVIVDGNPIPAGTVLKVVGGKASDRIWCRRLMGRATPKPFLVKKDELDFGEEIIVVDFEATLEKVHVHAVQVGDLLFPVRGHGGEVAVVMQISGEWVAANEAGSYTGGRVTKLRLPVWLAREKDIDPSRR